MMNAIVKQRADLIQRADAEIALALQKGDAYVASRYLRIVKALTAKAEMGDKGAAEILLKCVTAPTRERVEAQVAKTKETPSVQIARALVFLNENSLGGKGVISELNLQLANGDGAPPVDSTQLPISTVPASVPTNHVCVDCREGFYSPQPLAKRCSACKKQRSMQKLLDHKREHGKLTACETKLVATKGL